MVDLFLLVFWKNLKIPKRQNKGSQYSIERFVIGFKQQFSLIENINISAHTNRYILIQNACSSIFWYFWDIFLVPVCLFVCLFVLGFMDCQWAGAPLIPSFPVVSQDLSDYNSSSEPGTYTFFRSQIAQQFQSPLSSS